MSYLLSPIDIKAWKGLTAIIPTIIIGKIDIELPAIHIMNRFIGTCLIGPKATSHDLCERIMCYMLQITSLCITID